MQELSIVFKHVKEKFKQQNIDDDPARFVADILHLKIEDIFLNHSIQITLDQFDRLENALARRLQGEPLSRIIGKRSFWRDEFHVSPETLDPRADSETIIESVLKHATSPKRILDLGTGTGCLLLSLLREYPVAVGVGIDQSLGAIRVAQRNAHDLGFTDRAHFVHSDWSDYDFEQSFDVIVSNPPYISSAVIPTLDASVRLYDPRDALDGGADGLDAYRVLAQIVPKMLTPAGLLVLEIGYDQGASVPPLFTAQGLKLVSIDNDLGGNERAVVLQHIEKY